MVDHPDSGRKLLIKVFLWLVPGILGILAMFFLPAGTLDYWQAWVFGSILIIPTLLVFIYLYKKSPETLRIRMKTNERDAKQKLIINLSGIFLTPVFVIPGFDRRWGWSVVPFSVVIVADIVALLGYLIFFLVIKENSFASRVIEVEQGQKVISTGPYAVVRHPMYVGMTLMYLATPLALGSYWALIPGVTVIPIIIARILNEERLLLHDLPGYAEYMQKVKYRLIPRIW